MYCYLFCPIETLVWYTEKIPAANQGEREEASGAERGCEDSQGEFWEEEEELLVSDSVKTVLQSVSEGDFQSHWSTADCVSSSKSWL